MISTPSLFTHSRLIAFTTLASVSLLSGCGGGSDSSETTPPPAPPAADDIPTAIVGAWQTQCRSMPALNTSERRILAFDGSTMAQDFYEYDGLDCAGVPRGQTFPLRLYGYTVGAEVTTDDGSVAREIDLEIAQMSDVGVLRDGATMGQMNYGLVGFNANGELMLDDGPTSSPDNRPSSFDEFVSPLVARTAISNSINSIADIAGNYRANCILLNNSGSSYTTTVITDSTGDILDDYFLNDYCAGPTVMQIRTPTSLVPEPQGMTTFFGDSAVNVFQSEAAQEVVFGEEFLSFDLRGARDRYTLYALGNGDTFLRGDCVVRESSCKTSTENFADMIDLEFNSILRHKRVASAEYSNLGTSDTSVVAGQWDFSNAENNFYAYQTIEANGTGTYYEVEGGTPDSENACIRTFAETITAYDNNAYQYAHTADDPQDSYSVFIQQVVENGVLIQTDVRNEETNEYPALAQIPDLPDC